MNICALSHGTTWGETISLDSINIAQIADVVNLSSDFLGEFPMLKPPEIHMLMTLNSSHVVGVGEPNPLSHKHPVLIAELPAVLVTCSDNQDVHAVVQGELRHVEIGHDARV